MRCETASSVSRTRPRSTPVWRRRRRRVAGKAIPGQVSPGGVRPHARPSAPEACESPARRLSRAAGRGGYRGVAIPELGAAGGALLGGARDERATFRTMMLRSRRWRRRGQVPALEADVGVQVDDRLAHDRGDRQREERAEEARELTAEQQRE